jgi:hypothetical protein
VSLGAGDERAFDAAARGLVDAGHHAQVLHHTAA